MSVQADMIMVRFSVSKIKLLHGSRFTIMRITVAKTTLQMTYFPCTFQMIRSDFFATVQKFLELFSTRSSLLAKWAIYSCNYTGKLSHRDYKVLKQRHWNILKLFIKNLVTIKSNKKPNLDSSIYFWLPWRLTKVIQR